MMDSQVEFTVWLKIPVLVITLADAGGPTSHKKIACFGCQKKMLEMSAGIPQSIQWWEPLDVITPPTSPLPSAAANKHML